MAIKAMLKLLLAVAALSAATVSATTGGNLRYAIDTGELEPGPVSEFELSPPQTETITPIIVESPDEEGASVSTACIDTMMVNPEKILTCSNILEASTQSACGSGNPYFIGSGANAKRNQATVKPSRHLRPENFDHTRWEKCSPSSGKTVGWNLERTLLDPRLRIRDGGMLITDGANLNGVRGTGGCCSVGGGNWDKGTKRGKIKSRCKMSGTSQRKPGWASSDCCTSGDWKGSAPIYEGNDYQKKVTEAEVEWHQHNFNTDTMKKEIFTCAKYVENRYCKDGNATHAINVMMKQAGTHSDFDWAIGDGFGAPKGETALTMCCACGGGVGSSQIEEE